LITDYIKQIRVIQWLKNLIIFLPIIVTQEIYKFNYQIIYCFFLLSFLSSFFYCLNDLRDLEQDSQHKIKKQRPYAAGKITKPQLLSLAFICLLLAIFFYFLINNNQILKFLLIYAISNFIYNFYNKKIKFLDFFFLLLFYYLRICVGEAILSSQLSEWVVIIIFLYLIHLAVLKRYHEILKIKKFLKINYKNYNRSDLVTFKIILIINFIIYLTINLFYFLYTDSKFLNLDIWNFYMIQLLILYILYNLYETVKNNNINKDFFELVINIKKNYLIIITIFFLLFLNK
jgi:4-hydroxybenzoate polyprenyltransferase